MTLRLGDTAPDFQAETTAGPLHFHEWIGDGWAVLFSHPRDFTPVCTTELGYVARLKPELEKRGVKAIGLSIDPIGSHRGWVADIQETQAGLAGAWGVDVRDPFHDRRLVEFCFALPAEQKIRGGRTRVVMRHALGSVLPSEVRDRPGKAPLYLMLPRALDVAGPERLAALIDEARHVLAPYVDPVALDRVYRRYRERAAPPDMARVFRIAALTTWLRRVGPAA